MLLPASGMHVHTNQQHASFRSINSFRMHRSPQDKRARIPPQHQTHVSHLLKYAHHNSHMEAQHEMKKKYGGNESSTRCDGRWKVMKVRDAGQPAVWVNQLIWREERRGEEREVGSKARPEPLYRCWARQEETFLSAGTRHQDHDGIPKLTTPPTFTWRGATFQPNDIVSWVLEQPSALVGSMSDMEYLACRKKYVEERRVRLGLSSAET